MIRHGTSLELPLAYQNAYLTPVDQFFVCNSGNSPMLSIQDYRLRIWGDGVAQELYLSYTDLYQYAQHTVPALIECAGNHRSLFNEIDGKPIVTPAGTTELIWGTGAVGMAEWTGVSLADVLVNAGIKPDAMHVCPTGAETDSIEGTVRLPMPVEKAMNADTLLTLQMNGQSLQADHGFPVRVLVPGWIGAYSIKWVQDIEVSCKPIQVRRNTHSYVLMGDQWPANQYAPASGKPITSYNIKSALALPWPAQFESGIHKLHGFARSSGNKIQHVAWSDNNGTTWQDATLVGKNEKYGWVKFEFNWSATSGNHAIKTRAVDEAGQVQPDKVPFNTAGYLYNAVYPHPVRVS